MTQSPKPPVLACQNLSFSYPGQDRNRAVVHVLRDISFSLNPGEVTALLGRNGSGKTTLIHCLNQTRKPDTGKIMVQGVDIKQMDPRQIARRISLVPQEHLDIFPFKVMDVVVMGRAPFLGLAQKPGPGDYQAAARALDRLNAGYLAQKNFNRISGGERQMALLARAMVQSTGLILLDEPCNHLDFNNQFLLLSRIRELTRTREISILASMHDPNMAALFADQVVMLRQGRVLAQGRTDQVMTDEHISRLYETRVAGLSLKSGKTLFFPESVIAAPQLPRKAP